MRLSRASRCARKAVLAAVTSVLVTSSVWVADAALAPLAHADDTGQKVLFLLDVSGSMNDPIASGGSKLAAAKTALKQVTDALPDGTQVGLRVFGSEIADPKETNPAACQDTKLVLPIGPLSKTSMYAAVDGFAAKGETPISYSLRESVKDLGSSGKRTLIFISDGEENCGGDPCATASELAKTGIDLQFNAIGLNVNSTARQQLQCIVTAGRGSYYDATQAQDLAAAIATISKRALRPFAVSGTPIRGAATPAAGPTLASGQYVDSYELNVTPRYYRIPRDPGSTVTASIAAVVSPFGATSMEDWELQLSTESGTSCAKKSFYRSTVDWRTVVSGAISAPSLQSSATTPASDPCQNEPLVLSMARTSGNPSDTPVQLVVTSEPAISNLSSLPAPASPAATTSQPVAAGAVQATTGGISFSDSPALTPGSWTDTIAWGEQVFYRVQLDYGQALRVTADTPAPGTPPQGGDGTPVSTKLSVFSASRLFMADKDSKILTGQGSDELTLSTPEVRVRNRFDSNDAVQASSTAGFYYVSIAVIPTQPNQNGRLMPVQLNVAVDGAPAGQPAYAAASASTTASVAPPSTTSASGSVPTTAGGDATAVGPVSDGGPAAGLIAGSILAVAVGAALLVWMRRRRAEAAAVASRSRHES